MKDPGTLILAWAVLPALVAAVSGGIGLGLARAGALPLGALTLPAGFLAAMAVGAAMLNVGAPAGAAVAAVALLSLGGYAWELRGRSGRPRPDGAFWFAAAAGLIAFGVTLAPLVGSGHSGILGYTLNNDPSVHVAAIELIRENGARVQPEMRDSYGWVSTNFSSGYPIGSYVWPLFAATVGGLDAFHLWTPLIAVSAGMLALVVFAVLRRLGAWLAVAALGGVAVACGYLPYSYAAQGGAKEVQVALGIYAAIALFGAALAVRWTWRTLLPAAACAAGAVSVFGVAAGAWLGPAGLLALAGTLVVVLRRRASGDRVRLLSSLGAATLAFGLLALPSIVLGARFVREAGPQVLNDPTETGNLLAPVRWVESLNVWLARDYRYPMSEEHDLTLIGLWLAGGLAVLGIAHALRRRQPAVPLAAIAGGAGVLVVLRGEHGIYFDAKALCILAPAAGLASAAGVVALGRLRGAAKHLATVLGLVLLVGVAASDVYVYRGAWVTPDERFDQLAAINERFAGRGPILVNEREDYAKIFLRDVEPWDSWGAWQSDRGLRAGPVPPAPPHLPDFDDYETTHIARFPLLLERKRPGGSLPPASYRVAEETEHYRVWERTRPLPPLHVPVGNGDVIDGMGELDCAAPEVRELLDGPGTRRLLVSRGQRVFLSLDFRWRVGGQFFPGPLANFNNRLDGNGTVPAPVPPGRYDVWLQGSFGPGVRLLFGRRTIGEVFSDPSIHDAHHRLGTVTVRRPYPVFLYHGLQKPFWQAGSRRWNLVGPMALVPTGDDRDVERIAARGLQRLCGEKVDWIEAL